MSRWNHFGTPKYATVLFDDIEIGQKFRKDFFKNKRRRSDIICVKTGVLSFTEEKSKVPHVLYHSKGFTVYSFSQLNQPKQ